MFIMAQARGQKQKWQLSSSFVFQKKLKFRKHWWNKMASTKKTRLSYEEAKKILKPLGLQSSIYFWALDSRTREGLNLPKNPEGYYKRQGVWLGWGDFLGLNNPKKGFISYEEAKEILKPLGIKSKTEFEKFAKKSNFRNLGIPKHTRDYYQRQGTWINWDDFLSVESRLNETCACSITFTGKAECKRNPLKNQFINLYEDGSWSMYESKEDAEAIAGYGRVAIIKI